MARPVMRRTLVLALIWGGTAGAQTVLRVAEPGPTAEAKTVVKVLSSYRHVIPPGAVRATLPSDSAYRGTVVVLGRDAAVSASVAGDLVVVGGDLFLHPGADVRGRAIAVGGGVYESSLAHVGGRIAAHRDFTYDVEPIAGGFLLRYRSLEEAPPILQWPGLYGVRSLVYDRSNGMSLPVSPRLALRRVELEPRVTYRSQLGTVDPWLDASVDAGSATSVQLEAGRGTFSNEQWFWNDLVNSAATLWGGDDARNYYRATRLEAALSRRWDWRASGLEPFAGVRWERDRSVRPGVNALGGPWSVLGRGDLDDMLRPNPRIDDGDITSMVAGARYEWTGRDAAASLRLDAEAGRLTAAPFMGTPSFNFAQLVWDGDLAIPTVGAQRVRVDAHAVLPLSSATPRQRWAYLGGPGTIPTLGLLSRGGDRLLYLAAQYSVPLERWRVSVLGSPAIALRGVLAGADVGHWPAFAQAVGLRVLLSAAYIEYMAEPFLRHGSIGVGITTGR